MKKNASARITLDEEASVRLFEMCEEIKKANRFVGISPSRLASWITKFFHGEDFEAQKAKIGDDHLNRRKWLNNALKRANDGDMEGVLREALGEMAKKKRRQNKTLRRLGE